MSTTAGLPLVQEKGYHISYNVRRHDNSGELDVFEAAEYFSGANEMYGASFTRQQKMMRSGGRMSLDILMMSRTTSSVPSPTCHQKATKDEKKSKKPNSPGVKLASFLNSLFNQTSSKKKKSKTSYTESMKGDRDHEIGRRKRRSSISHFRSVNTIPSSTCNSSDSKSSSFYSSSSSSEFKTPRDHESTPTTNSSKDFQSQSDHNSNVMLIGTLSMMKDINVHVKPSSSSLHKAFYIEEKTENSWLKEEKFKFRTSNEFSLEKCNNFVNGILGEEINHSEDSTNFKSFINDEDDGADSDSSSDLFELQNFDLVSPLEKR